MPIPIRPLLLALVLTLSACGLCACGTINEKLAEGVGDYVPQWLGGLPPDAPPRPGSAKYDEYMRERDQRRLQPAPTGQDAAKSGPAELDPVH